MLCTYLQDLLKLIHEIAFAIGCLDNDTTITFSLSLIDSISKSILQVFHLFALSSIEVWLSGQIPQKLMVYFKLKFCP